MEEKKLKEIYKTRVREDFPDRMEISFVEGGSRQTIHFEKVTWEIDGENRGLRYGENPCQPAALYRPLDGNIAIGEVVTLEAGQYLASDIELLQSGKHPGKTNLTDIDNGLNIMRYFSETPMTVIIKHNNPSGAAIGSTLAESFLKAYRADATAAFGGAITVNRQIDAETARLVAERYFEVIAAPEFSGEAMDILRGKKNLRIMRIRNIERLSRFIGKRVLDFKTLMDGGMIVQLSYQPRTLSPEAFLPARTVYNGKTYEVNRIPDEQEASDLVFGWLVESGITSNSIFYVRDGVTIGIGTGEQDRVGVAEIARDKAYKKSHDRLALDLFGRMWKDLPGDAERREVEKRIAETNGGLRGSRMISDAFFPFRDAIDVGLSEGVTAVIQPGGAERDFESICACNERGAAMVFTGQRSFKH